MVTMAKGKIVELGGGYGPDLVLEVARAFGYVPITEVVLVSPNEAQPNPRNIAGWLSWVLAAHEALMMLIGEAVILSQTEGHWERLALTYQYRSYSGERATRTFPIGRRTLPGAMTLASWARHDGDGLVVTNGDLFLSHVNAPNMTDGVAEAIREAAANYRDGRLRSCVAMLGSALEGAWMEVGQAMVSKLPTDHAKSLRQVLENPGAATGQKQALVARAYRDKQDLLGRPFERGEPGLRPPTKLEGELVLASQVRAARNTIHWGPDPRVPVTVESVGVLMMAAANQFALLYRVIGVLSDRK